MSTLLHKVNSGPLADMDMHATGPNTMPDTSAPVSAALTFAFFLGVGEATVAVTAALYAGAGS